MSIFVNYLFKLPDGSWKFRDPLRGIFHDVLLPSAGSAVDAMIEASPGLNHRDRSEPVAMIFSDESHPGADLWVYQRQDEREKRFIYARDGVEASLCHLMLRYFKEPPPCLWVKAGSISSDDVQQIEEENYKKSHAHLDGNSGGAVQVSGTYHEYSGEMVWYGWRGCMKVSARGFQNKKDLYDELWALAMELEWKPRRWWQLRRLWDKFCVHCDHSEDQPF